MDILICVFMICMTALVWQRQKHCHQIDLAFNKRDEKVLSDRIEQLEVARATEVDPKAFQELQRQVDAMRLAQGLKVSR